MNALIILYLCIALIPNFVILGSYNKFALVMLFISSPPLVDC